METKVIKIEMNSHAESFAVVTAICICICVLGYLIIAVWWAGISDNKTARNLAEIDLEREKVAACAQTYAFNEIREKHYVVESYCGGQINE